MQASREEALAGDGQKGCCYSQGCQSLDQKADILVFAIMLAEPRVERREKKAICLRQVKTQNSIHPQLIKDESLSRLQESSNYPLRNV